MVITYEPIAAQFGGVASNQIQTMWTFGIIPRQGFPDILDPSFNAIESLAPIAFTESFNAVIGTFDESTLSTGLGVTVTTQYQDFHFRLWVIPSILNLSNPQLGTDISFRLWNTYSDAETISSVLVTGSSVLTFNISPGTQLKDAEFRQTTFQIGPGEPSIEAVVQFITENLSGELTILAAISSTFNLIPDIPVIENWQFKTDILTNYRGQEQRIALRRYPRIAQEFQVEIIDVRQRKEQYFILKKNISVQSLISFYQYATVITAATFIGGTKIFFDPIRTNVRVNEFLVVINTTTEAVFIGKIIQIDLDGAVVSSSVGEDIDTRTWIAMPAYFCTVEDGSGITMSQVTGTLQIKANTFSEPTLLRPGATRTIGFFDGLPFLNRRPLSQADENFEYRREIIDNEVGVRDLNSRDLHPRISGTRKFTVQRNSDPEEMDYWRSLFDTTRGAQKSFLISTFFPDMSLTSGQAPLTIGVSSFIVNEGEAVNSLMQFETWKRIQIEFPGALRTQHTITSFVSNMDGTATLNFTPALPSNAAYTSPTLISFLMRVRASDRVAWQHYAGYSEVSFGIITTDE